jgi:hypothetical protein
VSPVPGPTTHHGSNPACCHTGYDNQRIYHSSELRQFKQSMHACNDVFQTNAVSVSQAGFMLKATTPEYSEPVHPEVDGCFPTHPAYSYQQTQWPIWAGFAWSYASCVVFSAEFRHLSYGAPVTQRPTSVDSPTSLPMRAATR